MPMDEYQRFSQQLSWARQIIVQSGDRSIMYPRMPTGNRSYQGVLTACPPTATAVTLQEISYEPWRALVSGVHVLTTQHETLVSPKKLIAPFVAGKANFVAVRPFSLELDRFQGGVGVTVYPRLFLRDMNGGPLQHFQCDPWFVFVQNAARPVVRIQILTNFGGGILGDMEICPG